jgi:hypothetical protein
LFKEEGSGVVEGMTLAIYIIVSLLLLAPLRSEVFFI